MTDSFLFDDSDFGATNATSIDASWQNVNGLDEGLAFAAEPGLAAEATLGGGLDVVGAGSTDGVRYTPSETPTAFIAHKAVEVGASPDIFKLDSPPEPAPMPSSITPSPPPARPGTTSQRSSVMSGDTTSSATAMHSVVPASNAALREWETKHEEELDQKRAEEDKLREERRKVAQESLTNWYKERAAKLAEVRKANREKDAESRKFVQPKATSANSKFSWSRVCDILELDSCASPSHWLSKAALRPKSPTGLPRKGSSLRTAPLELSSEEARDTTRMLQLLLSLKDEEESEGQPNGTSR